MEEELARYLMCFDSVASYFTTQRFDWSRCNDVAPE